jgi:hypothetical protein
MKTYGTRAQVWHGTAKKTKGGLTKQNLFKKKGRIKSKKASKKAKQNKNLKKAGWTFKKGEFGAISIEEKRSSSRSKKTKKKSKGLLGGLFD